VVEVGEYAAEDLPRRESQRGEERIERGDARVAGAARSRLEEVPPEDVRRAWFLGRVGDVGVADDLRGGLE
jgi:hypothetical protein